MNSVTAWCLIPVLGYLIGSTPFGYLLAKVASGMDIRREGSGNIGATNVGRVLGAKWGIIVLVLDFLKGYLAVELLPLLGPPEIHRDLAVWSGFTAILGHMFSVWLSFKGGKGVATALGCVTALSPVGTVAAVSVFLFIVGSTRLVSAGSISAVVTFAIAWVMMTGPRLLTPENRSMTIFSLAIPTIIVVGHRQNLLRLLRGTEPKLGSRTKTSEKQP